MQVDRAQLDKIRLDKRNQSSVRRDGQELLRIFETMVLVESTHRYSEGYILWQRQWSL